MKADRRSLIKTGALTLAGAAILNNSLFAAGKQKGIVGLQLVSVRDDISRDPLGSLTQLAKMGHTHSEHASYADRTLVPNLWASGSSTSSAFHKRLYAPSGLRNGRSRIRQCRDRQPADNYKRSISNWHFPDNLRFFNVNKNGAFVNTISLCIKMICRSRILVLNSV